MKDQIDLAFPEINETSKAPRATLQPWHHLIFYDAKMTMHIIIQTVCWLRARGF